MFKTDINISDDEAIRLWYEGLGKEYRRTRSPRGGYGTTDSPRLRQITYAVFGLMMGAIAVIFMKNILMFEVNVPIILLVLLVVIMAAIESYRALKLAYRLQNAIRQGGDCDRIDSYRMGSIRRSARWGLKKGFVIKNDLGSYSFQSRQMNNKDFF